VEKCGAARGAPDNTAHARGILDKQERARVRTQTNARIRMPHPRAGARAHTKMQYLLFHGNNCFVNAT
jgi:hypothetical protein